MESDKEIRTDVRKKVRLKTVVESLLAIFFILMVILGLMAYYFSPSENSIAGKFLKKISYPIVAIEGRNFIYTSELRDSLSVLEKYYESEAVQKTGNRADFSTEDGKKRLKMKEKEVLNKEIENEALKILAKRKGIVLSNEEVNEHLSTKISVEGFLGQDMNDFVVKYGWTIDKIRNKIIIPSLYVKKLKESISSELETGNKTAKETISAAKKELDEGRDFAEIAKKYSQGSTAEKGGELGWMTKQQMLPEVANEVFSPEFQLSKNVEIIESVLGYHIVKIEEVKKEEGSDSIRISQIFTRKKTFYDWLDDQVRDMNIKILTKEYYWDKERGVVEFTDETLREFEKNERENPKGDASISDGRSQNIVN